jgi:tetrapyrrole methylase family protein/MazG family protein
MAGHSPADGGTAKLVITIAGLGPGNIDRVPEPVLAVLLDPDRKIVLRTLDHPAARQLAARRTVTSCDDLYEAGETFDDVYEAIVTRVLDESRARPVVYAVPGSPLVGEFAVRKLLESGEHMEVIPGESFIDAILAEIGYDPMDRGLQVLDGHSLPDPLILDKPTIIGHLDSPEVMADIGAAVDRVTVEGSEVTVLANLGSGDAVVLRSAASSLDVSLAGYRTSLFVDAEPGGLVGAIRAMRILRVECPWDREQTHGSLAKYLVEETHELIDAIVALEPSPDDLVAYAGVEDELGDVLLSVLFHAAIAREAGVFDIDDVSEVLRQKLVRRHPHVFSDVEVGSASEVKANWDLIKAAEISGSDDGSVLDGVPTGMPALQRASKVQNRAAKVGFDWSHATDVLDKVREEMGELAGAMSAEGDVPGELGDLLFSLVNLSRHLRLDPELALAAATRRFEERFRKMEADGPLDDVSLEELDRRWEQAKLDQ